MNPQLHTSPEALGGTESGKLSVLKNARHGIATVALSILAATGVQGCSKAEAQDASTTQVAQLSQTIKPTPASFSVSEKTEKLPTDAIISRLRVLVETEIPAEQHVKYLGDGAERKGYIQQIAENNAPRRSKFKIIMGLGDGEGKDLLIQLSPEFDDIHDTIDNIQARESLSQSEESLALAKAKRDLLDDVGGSINN